MSYLLFTDTQYFYGYSIFVRILNNFTDTRYFYGLSFLVNCQKNIYPMAKYLNNLPHMGGPMAHMGPIWGPI